MKFTEDPYIIDTLKFLMMREVAHYRMFEFALETIQPNFPPEVLQGDPRFTQQYFNLSPEKSVRGPWNEGETPGLGKDWEYIEKPIDEVKQTEGLSNNKRGSKEKENNRNRKVNQEISDK